MKKTGDLGSRPGMADHGGFPSIPQPHLGLRRPGGARGSRDGSGAWAGCLERRGRAGFAGLRGAGQAPDPLKKESGMRRGWGHPPSPGEGVLSSRRSSSSLGQRPRKRSEQLLFRYLLAHTEKEDEKLYLLCTRASDILATLFRQTMFAEFELKVHEAVEKGTPLTADYCCAVYRKQIGRAHV